MAEGLITNVARLGQIFSPDRPVDDPSALFGRDDELRKLLVSLGGTARSVPVLVGPPGIGKTSLLRVLQQALIGQPEVLDPLGLADCALEPINRLAVTLRCDRTMVDANSLSAAIIRHITRAFQEQPSRRKFSLRTFSLEGSTSFVKGAASWERIAQSVESDYSQLVRRISALQQDRAFDEVIFVLDECEQLPWLDTLLDYTRDFDDVGCRFVLAVRDHAADRLANPSFGDYRWPDWVDVPGLNRAHIRGLYDRAERQLAELQIIWSITTEAISYITKHSSGEPWYLQMIGHELLYNRDIRLETKLTNTESSDVVLRVGLNDVLRAEREMLRSRLGGLHRARYTALASGAPKREELLRSFAHFPETLIPADFLVHVRRHRIGGASDIIKKLTESEAPPLISVPGKSAYQFADHQFRVYCRLAKPTNDSVDLFAKNNVASFFDSESWQQD